MLVEVRVGGGGKGAQTIFPGSTHSTTGELITWERDNPPPQINGEELIARVKKLAAAALLARYWPMKGTWHEAGLTLSSFLVRAGWAAPDAEHFLRGVALAAPPSEKGERVNEEDLLRSLKGALEKARDKLPLQGLPALKDTWGEKVAEQVAKWLGYVREAGEEFDRASDPSCADGRAPLPKILIRKGLTAQNIDAIQNALVKAELPILVRGGVLVEPIWTEYDAHGGRKTQITVLRKLKPMGVAYMLTKHAAICEAYNGTLKAIVPIDPPKDILVGLCELGHWPFPRVRGIISAPTLRPDGSVLEAKGWDRLTGLWLEPPKDFKLPLIAECPTRGEAEEALQLFEALLVGFPFVGDLDKAVAVSAILTAVLRGAFDLAPMCLFSAHEAGTGKSYLVDLISTIVSGRPCPVITFAKDENEMEKRLGSLLLEGCSMFSLDNCSNDLTGDTLCQMLSQTLVKPRILGLSETPECEWRGTLFATGNNIGFRGDMARRGLTCNLDAQWERPEQRAFEFNPIERVMKDRGVYLAAAITIARAYLSSGGKVDCSPLGTYGEWSRFVREPLIWLGMEDPVKSQEQAVANDPERENCRALIAEWKEHVGLRPIKVAQLIECANERSGSNEPGWAAADYVRPGLRGVLLEVGRDRRGEMIDARKLGNFLRKIQGRVFDDYRIVLSRADRCHGGEWMLQEVHRPKAT